MYAKVMKKKRDSVDDELNLAPSTSGTATARDPRRKHSLIEVNRASWSSHDSVEILKRESDVANLIVKEQQQLRINGEPLCEEFDFDHGYESVVADKTTPNKVMTTPSGDTTYEILRPSSSAGATALSRNGGDTLPIYAMPFKHRQVRTQP